VAARAYPVPNLGGAEEEQKASTPGLPSSTLARRIPAALGDQSLTNPSTVPRGSSRIIVETGEPRWFMDTTWPNLPSSTTALSHSPALNDESIASVVNLEPFLAADASTARKISFPQFWTSSSYQARCGGCQAASPSAS